MKPLYELAHEFRAIAEQLENSDLPDDCIAETLDGCALEFDEKIASIAAMLRNWEAMETALKAEEKRLGDRRRSIGTRIEKLEAYVIDHMQKAGRTKVNHDLFDVSVRTNPVSVVITGEVPKDLCIEHLTPNKTKIKEAIEQGEIFEFAYLDRSNSLIIK